MNRNQTSSTAPLARWRGARVPLPLHSSISTKASTHHRVPRQCQLARYTSRGKGYDRHLDRCSLGVHELGLLEWLRLERLPRARCLDRYFVLERRLVGGSRRRRAAVLDRQAGAFDVAPVGGRLVIFDAGAVEHAVLAASADRVALTVWINSPLE